MLTKIENWRLMWISIALMLTANAAPAGAQWQRAETENFILYADGSEAEIRQKTADLERFDQLLRMFTTVEAERTGPKFKVFELRSASAVSRRFYGTASGIYIPSLRGPFAIVPRRDVGFNNLRSTSQEILFHEYVHHFMLQYFPASYPSWYREGFAEFFSTVAFLPDGQVDIGYPVQAHVPFLTEPGDWRDYEDILTNRAGFGYMTYAQGWLLVHHAFFNAPARQALSVYLDEMRRGATVEDAYQTAFGDLDWNLHGAVRRYYQNDEVPVRTANIEFDEIGSIQVTALTEEEEDVALIYAREDNAYGGRVRGVADEYPENAQAQAELAHFLIADKDYEDAIEAGRRAVELNPELVDANLMLGAALVNAARDSDNPDDPRWAEGREYILRANRADPYQPFALYMYYRSFPPLSEKPEYALAALEQAFRFVPQNWDARTALAIEFLRAERFDEARLLIMPMINTIHHNHYDYLVERVMERIEARNSDVDDLLVESVDPDTL